MAHRNSLLVWVLLSIAPATFATEGDFYLDYEPAFTSTRSEPTIPWHLDRLDSLTPALDFKYAPTFSGSGVTIYVVDSGIRASHGEFDGRASIAADFSSLKDNSILKMRDCNGHGSHVAGVIGGRTYGIAKAANLVGLRVLDCEGRGSEEGVLEALQYIQESPSNQTIINLSLVSSNASPAFNRKVRELAELGFLIVSGAGNAKADACDFSPGNSGATINVGASGLRDTPEYQDIVWEQSNYGPCVDVFAPGIAIKSAYHLSDSASVLLSGTSMATAMVSGVAALLWEADPAASAQEIRDWMIELTLQDQLDPIAENTKNLLANIYHLN